jgi:hypothetical protein
MTSENPAAVLEECHTYQSRHATYLKYGYFKDD